MSSIASKNLYELLGNDPELDPDRAPEPPTKAIDKPAARTGKRNAPAEPPTRSGGATRAPKDSGSANDNYLRDRGVGSDKNRSRGSGEPGDSGYRGGRGRGRGGRGRGRGGAEGDRHSRTGVVDHEKQAAHGWGGNDGNAELADEQAGEAIAQEEEKEVAAEAGENGEEAAPEPEDKTKSYAAYLAEQAEKKLSLAASNVRQANEGSSKQFPEGTAIARDEDEDAYITGSGGKNRRTRERKEKTFVELDGDRMLQQAPRDNFRGRGRGRGEGRGEFRGRGGRGRGEVRGRGGRGGAQSGPNVSDTSAFPSLGS